MMQKTDLSNATSASITALKQAEIIQSIIKNEESEDYLEYTEEYYKQNKNNK